MCFVFDGKVYAASLTKEVQPDEKAVCFPLNDECAPKEKKIQVSVTVDTLQEAVDAIPAVIDREYVVTVGEKNETVDQQH